MKKFLAIVVVGIIMGSFLWGDLQDYYKKGRIVLKGVDDFGVNTAWEDYFYKPYSFVINSIDSSTFVICGDQHCIYKFDAKGNMMKKFGQRGIGPGDMISPTNPTIMDNKYIVVGEYATNRRVDIWDLDGNFLKLVRTKKNNYSTTALKENKIAYFTHIQNANKNNGFQEKYQVIIKDTNVGKETVIREISLLDRSWIELGKYSTTKVGHFFGKVFIKQTIEGNLAVGTSIHPSITIYSSKGEAINRFELKIKPIPVTVEYIKRLRNEVLADLRKDGEKASTRTEKYWYEEKMKIFPKYDFSKIFGDYLPLYYEILVDCDGNFLIFPYRESLKNSKIYFQVYSKKGEFVCETELDPGNYAFFSHTRLNNLCFTSDAIIGYTMEKGDEEEVYRLIKSNY